MKDLLVICWAMPPLLNPRAIQVSRTLHQLKKSGWSSTVICVDPRSLNGRYPIDPDFGSRRRASYETVPLGTLSQSLGFRLLSRFLPDLKRTPDAEGLWAKRAVAAAKRLASGRRFDALITFGYPWSCHMAGLAVQQETKLPWIAHFSDPWSESPYEKASFLSKQMESKVLGQANRVVFVNSYTADVMNKKFPALAHKSTVIPHGFDPDDFLAGEARGARPSSLVLTHVGQLYGLRLPWALIEALSKLPESIKDRLIINFVGATPRKFVDQARQRGLGENIRFIGPQSFKQSAASMAESDALLLIEAPETNLYFPSKLVDYLGAKKPILGMVPSPGPSADLLNRLHFPVVNPGDAAGIEKSLSDLVERKTTGRLSVEEDFEKTASEFNIQRTTEEWIALLEGLTKKTSV